MRRKVLLILLLLGLGATAAAGYGYYFGRPSPLRYQTVRVERGRIAATVNATGTLNAVVTVQVGSQVSGTIQKLFVDFNSPVKEDQIITQIDPASFETRVSQGRATLASAKAAVQVAQAMVENSKAAIETARANAESAKATIEKAKVMLVDARRTLERNNELVRQSLIAQSDLDTAQTAYDSAASQLKLSQAQHEAALGQLKSATAQARLAEAQQAAALAQVEQAKAVLEAAELDLSHTTIRSPVNGIVVSRNVDVGQTVAASLQAPTLFLIAQDLTRMQVGTSVSEADIGRVAEGQRATFTVDAYPNTTFMGRVVQVRNAPITVQNVVTYNAVVEVENADLKLRPGMTANVSFLISERSGALKIPNAALRFQPDGAGRDGGAQDARGGGGGDRLQALQQRLTRALALTSEQQTQLREILEGARRRATASREATRSREGESSEEARRARSREAQEQTRAAIRRMLTDAQRQQYEELLKTSGRQGEEAAAQGRPGRVWVLSGEGKPEPIPVMLGISDDTHTEVITEGLREGQEVITGVLAGAKRGSSTIPRFGTRFF
ncbi:MAG: efflux RND transporter periplasmic adaptor subunit [Nitrospinae bacterium]|nr:efflux RND transporter periplasmic adaptor subunit [Nitrospinota bacterium]